MKRWILMAMVVCMAAFACGCLGGCSSAPANPMGAAASPIEDAAHVIVLVAPTNAYGDSAPWIEASGKAKNGDRSTRAEGDTSANASASTSTDADATVEVDPPPSP